MPWEVIIEPLSHSGADMLAVLVVAALHPEFEGGDEIVIAGKAFRYLHVQYNTRRPTAGMLAECDCSLQVKWIPYCTKYGNACPSLTWTTHLLCLARETGQTSLPLSNSSGLIFALPHHEHCCSRERIRLRMLTYGRLLRSWAPRCPIGEPTFMARCAIICCYRTASAQPLGLDILLLSASG